jgi:cytochrome c553
MKRLMVGTLVLGLALVTSYGMTVAEDKKDEKKEKVSIKEVMKTAHKGGLLDKVQKGTATAEEKKKLADLYVALHENVPPKGDKESWEKKTDALVKASKDVLEGKKGAEDALKKAANCAACHKEHKGS